MRKLGFRCRNFGWQCKEKIPEKSTNLAFNAFILEIFSPRNGFSTNRKILFPAFSAKGR